MSQNYSPAGFTFAQDHYAMNLEKPKYIHYFLEKLFDFASIGMLSFTAILATGFNELFELIFQDIPHRDILIPLAISGITFLVFCFMFLIDFITGIVAAKAESAKKPFIQSRRLWSSVWKLVGVCVIILFLLIFHYVFIILEIDTISFVFEVALPTFMIIVIFYEIHSIGENLERKYGKKPKYFNFFEKAAEIFEKGIFDKLRKYLQ